MKRLVALTLVAWLAFGCPAIAFSGSDYVLVDRTEQAYTVYAGIPQDKFREVEEKLAQAPKGIVLLSWEIFARDADRYVNDQIVMNEYPDARTREGVLALVQKYPGTPIGLTWNGGIAITYNDYQHAKSIYAEYKADPSAYAARKKGEQRLDPIHPRGHLGPLLGW